MLRGALCLALTSALVEVAPTQTTSLPVTVRAGAVERHGSPAAASFDWPEALAEPLAACDTDHPVPWAAALVETGGGRTVACDVVAHPGTEGSAARGEIHFVLDRLSAGSERTYRLQLGRERAAATSPFVATPGEETRELRRASTPMLRHEFAFDRDDWERTSKPIWHLFVPGTDVLLTKGVGGEYSHHRGLFLGWNKTEVGTRKFDFWHCPTAGLRHAGYALGHEVQSAVRGEIATGTHWLSPLDEPVVRDRRTLTFWQRSGDADGGNDESTLLDVAIELSADQVVALRGDPQHAGFQIRVAEEVAERKDARYVRPTSAKDAKNDVWTDCPWVAGLFRIAGHEVAVVHMSHPQNPGPVSYSTRDYGRFGAFFEADIRPDQPLALRYRLLILRLAAGADVSVERFARAYADYAQPIEVEVGG